MPEGDSVDNLDSISRGQTEGNLVIIEEAAGASDMTVRHAQGGDSGIWLDGQMNFTLNSVQDLYSSNSGRWNEISRADNGL